MTLQELIRDIKRIVDRPGPVFPLLVPAKKINPAPKPKRQKKWRPSGE